MRPKDTFWIGAKGGLLEHKHIRAMGPSVWMYLYLLRGQTGLNEFGEGVFYYGHPITLEQVSNDLNGTPVATIRRWVARLKRHHYIRVEPHSHYGITIWIGKGKSKTRKPRIHTEVTHRVSTKNVQTSRGKVNGKSETSRAGMNANDMSSRHDLNANVSEVASQSEESKEFGAFPKTPTPKGFTSENLFNYNKAFKSSFSLLGKEKSIPQEKSPWEIDATRGKLLTQAEEIKRKYPSGEGEPPLMRHGD